MSFLLLTLGIAEDLVVKGHNVMATSAGTPVEVLAISTPNRYYERNCYARQSPVRQLIAFAATIPACVKPYYSLPCMYAAIPLLC